MFSSLESLEYGEFYLEESKELGLSDWALELNYLHGLSTALSDLDGVELRVKRKLHTSFSLSALGHWYYSRLNSTGRSFRDELGQVDILVDARLARWTTGLEFNWRVLEGQWNLFNREVIRSQLLLSAGPAYFEFERSESKTKVRDWTYVIRLQKKLYVHEKAALQLSLLAHRIGILAGLGLHLEI